MTEQSMPTDAAAQAASQPAAAKPAAQKPVRRAISDPRDVATLVMARMNMVNAKKDELAMAINGLVDLTQQLTRTYAEQLLAIEQLRARVKSLEAATGTGMSASASATPPLQ